MNSVSPHRKALIVAWQQKLIMALFTLLAFPNNLSAQGVGQHQPEDAGADEPQGDWQVRSCFNRQSRNRTRTRADKQRAEQATKDLYAKENRDS
jgi:hypothetical protein